jgi:hypothetical protein
VPFVSTAQERACFAGAMPGVDCHEWARKSKGKKLPRHVRNAASVWRRKRKLMRNGSPNAQGNGFGNSLKKRVTTNRRRSTDPTQSITLRGAMAAELKRRFARLKLDLYDLIVRDDAFGPAHVALNAFCPTGEGGGQDNSCSSHEGGAPAGDAVHGYVQGFADGKGTAEDFRQANRELKEDGSKYRLVPTADGKAQPMHVRDIVDQYGPRWSVAVNPLTGKLDAGDADWFREAAKFSGDKETRSYLHAFNDPKQIGTEADAKQANKELAESGNAHRIQWSKEQGLWVATKATHNERFAYASSPQKLAAFKRWLKGQIDLRIGTEYDAIWERYVESGFRKGILNAFRSMNPGRPVNEFYLGGKEQFLRMMEGRQVTVQKLKVLAARTWADIEGVTQQMGAKMTRILADGFVQELPKEKIAQRMSVELGIALKKSLGIVHNEFVHAHAEGQLDAVEELGGTHVTADVAWETAGENVCPYCEGMEGVVFTVKEARGRIPAHIGCKCGWHVVPMAMNAFCSTGPGGGIDPTCGHGSGVSKKLPSPKVQAHPNHGAGDKSKFVGQIVGKAEHEHAANVEKHVAKVLGGRWEEDNQFFDVQAGKNYVEVKSMLKGQKTAISVHADALIRKVDGIRQTGGQFHTVVFDERGTYQGGSHKENFSGHQIYYKRGSGRYSLGQMHPVADEAELKKLITMDPKALPEKARGSLPSGKLVTLLRQSAERAHESRLAKDRNRKERLKAEGKSAYERQT